MNTPQEFYKGDAALLEISKDCFCEVNVLEVKFEYGNIRYVVQPKVGRGEVKTEKLEKIN